MPIWLDVILEILKLTLPALIVFITVYYVLRQYLNSQYQLKLLDLRKEQQSQTLPLKLQAYERLSLFCERISFESLIMRLRSGNMNVDQLRYAMLVSVQKEYEHNLSQQVYVSEQLWEIIRIAKDEVLGIINSVANEMDGKAPAEELSNRLLDVFEEKGKLALNKAGLAIRKEVSIWLS
jgi:hypothetical protein